MQAKKMSARVKQIILILCKREDYITLAEIAQRLALSTKTVLRELPSVNEQLAIYGAELNKKSGVGIAIAGTSSNKQQMINLLAAEREDQVYSPQERRLLIISKLLQNKGTLKLYEFASICKVTEGTISTDLAKLEQWFSTYQLVLVRKPGLGIYIEGTEENIRRAMVHSIYENINEAQLLTILSDRLNGDFPVAVTKSSSSLMNLVDVKIIRKLEQAVRRATQGMQYELSDRACVGLIVHLAMAVQRIGKNENIALEGCYLQELQCRFEYKVAEKIAEEIAAAFALAVPVDEIGYITMHLLGARNQYGNGKVVDNFNLVKIARAMIKIAQAESGKNLMRNEKLLSGLVQHLGPSISRLNMHLELRNPLLPEMQQRYPEVLAIATKCAVVLEAQLSLKLPQAEIAYIAMHLGAAIEESGLRQCAEYRVAIACPTGMGTSRLLAAQINKQYPMLRIVDLISAVNPQDGQLKHLQVQFVISTMAMPTCTLPVVVVNSLLLTSDQAKIERQIWAAGEIRREDINLEVNTVDFITALQELSEYAKSIVQIIQHVFVRQDEISTTLEDLIVYVSKIVNQADTMQQRVLQAELLRRESYGSTLIVGQELSLLHCKTRVVEHLQFGVVQLGSRKIRLQNTINAPMIQTAIVMLVPSVSSKIEVETMGYIAEMLVEHWGFVEILHKGDQAMIQTELAQLFREFYQVKSKLLWEG